MGLADGVLAGDFLALSRAISQVEAGSPEGRDLLEAVHGRVGKALRVGLTGPPGVGKSTTVDQLAAHYGAKGEKVGIIAVDPSSPYTGGALLGDRVRMNRVAEAKDVFMRSMATRGVSGGIARATQDAADLLDASGRSLILLETVGVGQSEIEVSKAADCVVVLLSPESGDGVQAMKSGVLEAADIVLINKADRPGADRLEYELRSAFELGLRSRKDVPILCAQALSGTGIPELAAAIDAFVAARKADGGFVARRRRGMETRLRQLAEFLIQKDLWESPGAAARVEDAAGRVLEGRLSPYQGAQALIREVKP